MFNPIIAMLHDAVRDRWHPMYFRECPTPSADDSDTLVRYKSGGHHTTGFATRDEAVGFIHSEMESAIRKQAVGETRLCIDKAFQWDGEGIPASVVWFPKVGAAECVPVIG